MDTSMAGGIRGGKVHAQLVHRPRSRCGLSKELRDQHALAVRHSVQLGVLTPTAPAPENCA